MARSEDAEKQQHPEEVTTAPDNAPDNANSGPNACPASFRSTTQEILFILTATMGVAMPSFLQGCTIVISSFVGRDLNMTTSQITWITASSA